MCEEWQLFNKFEVRFKHKNKEVLNYSYLTETIRIRHCSYNLSFCNYKFDILQL